MAPRTKQVRETSNYSMFVESEENRNTHTTRHKALRRSMKKYGFLSCFPLVVRRYEDTPNKYEVRDGQHRLIIAREEGIPVWYIEEDTPFNVAEINCTGKGWHTIDYAEMYARNENVHYVEALDFSCKYGISISSAAAMLMGVLNYETVKDRFITGKFEVTHRDWATRCAELYNNVVGISKAVKGLPFLQTCMVLNLIDGFDAQRMLRKSHRQRDALTSRNNKKEYFHLLQEIYNYGGGRMFPLEVMALEVLRKRDSGKVDDDDPETTPTPDSPDDQPTPDGFSFSSGCDLD